MWYPTERGDYVNLDEAISLEIEKVESRFVIVARFAFSSKSKVALRILESREEAISLREWIVKEMNKQK